MIRVSLNRRTGFFLAVVSAAILLGLLPGEILAAEEISQGRKIYDTIMRWFNFGILAFLFMKYGKPALMNFLHGERNRIQRTLHEIEKEVNLAKMRVQEESGKLEAIGESLETMRNDIIEMGQREKERILQDAQSMADQMIEDAKKESAIKLEVAVQRLNHSIVDKAIAMAHEKLRQAFTERDDENTVQGFIRRLHEVKITEGAVR